ncbi:MAG: gamma-glutamyl-gamma-aminobutyrate hydrolase family protein [Chloroflexi bacterium]|nr:gamma-glutamyl-gamma-aminobutyrate hydrolase family protein [Chloroflexota bacterium]
MQRPLIGITTAVTALPDGRRQVTLRTQYAQAIVDAGGIPLLIVPGLDDAALDQLVNTLHGILIPGGWDVNPLRYGAKPHPATKSDDDLDGLEFPIIAGARRRHLPLLGICRGCQVLNVAFGGTLWQDLPSERPSSLVHPQRDVTRDFIAHDIHLERKSKLFTALQTKELPVNSFHHQGIQALGEGLRPVAFAPDGIVEGVEATGDFVVGIQCHPEDLYETRPVWRGLFSAFVSAARQTAGIANQ